jgi:hypothetical protein
MKQHDVGTQNRRLHNEMNNSMPNNRLGEIPVCFIIFKESKILNEGFKI